MAKRSPILGYNHNVRYRGLVFHVQTEDSGVLAPHLFTHLFHSGVIVSTRKYVYDSDATEETIKALMQAQHKVALKELKGGKFDDKIDQYLRGTPGLLPRGAREAADAEPPPGAPRSRASESALPVMRVGPVTGDEDEDLTDATVLGGEPAISREVTLEEPLALRPTEQAVEPPPLTRMASLAQAQDKARPTPQPSVLRAVLNEDYETLRHESAGDSQPEITIQLEAEEPDDNPLRRRRPKDTDTNPWDQTRIDLSMVSDGVPGALTGAATIRTPGDATGPVPTASSGPITGPLSQRAAKAVGAASLPPARPISRPASRPAMVPPQVVSRPLHAEDRRTPPPDAIEVYAPAPPSAELPQQPPERPGQYSQHKKISSRIPAEGAPERRSQQQVTIPMRPGSTPVIPQPGRVGSTPVIPQRATPVPMPVPGRAVTPPPMPPPVQRATPVPMPARTASPQPPVPGRTVTPPPVVPPPGRPIAAVPPQRPTPMPVAARAPGEPRTRTPTPQRVSVSTPSGGTPGLSAGRAGAPNSSSGVVMTRPAVIVGAPGKPAASTQRVRKAREDEGRGFGQGLISEKSLDEVILAYLSEDAEDK